MATKGWAESEVEQAHLLAKELSERAGDTTRAIGALWGLICMSVVRAELARTRILSEKLLELTRDHLQVPFQLAGHMELAGAAFGAGDLALADREFAIADAHYDPAQHAHHVARASFDQGVMLRSWWAHLCWHRGQGERAVALSDDALALSDSFGHPLSRAIALAYAAILHQFRRDTARCAELSAETLALCNEHGLAYYRTWGQIIGAWSVDAEDSALTIAASIRDLVAARARRCLPYFHGVLAEVHLRRGDRDAARSAIDDGLEISRAIGECWWVSELWRLKATVDSAATREHLHTALMLARQYGSPPLAERATAELVRFS
jgi:hypothetical protein